MDQNAEWKMLESFSSSRMLQNFQEKFFSVISGAGLHCSSPLSALLVDMLFSVFDSVCLCVSVCPQEQKKNAYSFYPVIELGYF